MVPRGEKDPLFPRAEADCGQRTALDGGAEDLLFQSVPLAERVEPRRIIEHVMREIYALLPRREGIGEAVPRAAFRPAPVFEVMADGGAEASDAGGGREEKREGPAGEIGGVLHAERPVKPVALRVPDVALDADEIIPDFVHRDVAARKTAVNFHDESTPFRLE